jgi:PKD repeat protein
MKRALLFVVAASFLLSCGKKPTSSFTVDKTEISVGESVQFTNSSTDAEYYHWKFGDGAQSREASPLHTFEKSGTFDVLLHVSNKGGDRWDNSYVTVKVNGYNSQLIGNWGVSGAYTSESCGNNSNQIYTMNIRSGSTSDELIISNFGDFFAMDVKGTSPYGDPNKIDFSATNVMNKSGELYNINGFFILSSGILNLTYTLSPAATSSCGIINGSGSGIKF